MVQVLPQLLGCSETYKWLLQLLFQSIFAITVKKRGCRKGTQGMWTTGEKKAVNVTLHSLPYGTPPH